MQFKVCLIIPEEKFRDELNFTQSFKGWKLQIVVYLHSSYSKPTVNEWEILWFNKLESVGILEIVLYYWSRVLGFQEDIKVGIIGC
jgi:hypothetical protein